MYKPTNTQEALENLGDIIDTLNQELQLYAKRPNPNMGYISKQNAHIQQLTHIYNCFDELEHYQLWAGMENAMQKALKEDPQLKGYILRVHTNPKGRDFYTIIFNPFEGKT